MIHTVGRIGNPSMIAGRFPNSFQDMLGARTKGSGRPAEDCRVRSDRGAAADSPTEVDQFIDGLANRGFGLTLAHGILHGSGGRRDRMKAVAAGGPLELMGRGPQPFPVGCLEAVEDRRDPVGHLVDEEIDDFAQIRVGAKRGVEWFRFQVHVDCPGFQWLHPSQPKLAPVTVVFSFPRGCKGEPRNNTTIAYVFGRLETPWRWPRQARPRIAIRRKGPHEAIVVASGGVMVRHIQRKQVVDTMAIGALDQRGGMATAWKRSKRTTMFSLTTIAS